MSMFPSVGSTVTRVLTNKSGTTAKVEFDDGTSLLVKYEALVIDSDQSSNEPPVQKESRVLMSGGIKPKAKVAHKVVSKPAQVMNESAYKALAAQALKRQESRQEKIFKQWESETGQFDHQAGPVK